ncbi:MAG: PD-(D/E)XK nuclease family protein [Clostridiales bacterium]|jgi:DNA excision repair protein ERCC-2|nr:PD-(D/E)XK nuclease family protein [Clostridiales bacterium]
MRVIKISVGALIEFAMRSGDIDARRSLKTRAREGTLAHQRLQRRREKRSLLAGDEYLKEVALSRTLDVPPFSFEVDGRADGITIKKDGGVIIEEIKSTVRPLDDIDKPSERHWAQVKIYAYMLNKERTGVRVTYISVENDELREFDEYITREEAKAFFVSVAERYVAFAELSVRLTRESDESAKQMSFPFESYRDNQRNFAVAVYKTIASGKKLFAQAPTGSGKTVSTVFPSIKALGEGLIDKIVYVTAKTPARSVAERTLHAMSRKGLVIRSVTLTAKHKICFLERPACYPEKCARANGHFDRVNAILIDMLNHETIMTREIIVKYAAARDVCPFELSLDAAIFADVIICDYNHVYDPAANLRRFFEKKRVVALHDEAHGMADRARDMYSAKLTEADFSEVIKQGVGAKKSIVKIKRWFDSMEEGVFFNKEPPSEFSRLLTDFSAKIDRMAIQGAVSDLLLDLYFKVLDFTRAFSFYDERFIFRLERSGHEISVKIICLDPSVLLAETQKKISASIFFSATLTPAKYFMRSLGGDSDDLYFRASSPFPRDNLCLLVDGTVSTFYKNRRSSLPEVVDRLYKMISGAAGVYMAFFPSYEYMRQASEAFSSTYPELNTAVQTPDMTESEREVFLRNLTQSAESSLVFAVLGGIFAEGVDLRLKGAAIVSVGLPLITPERSVMSEYYEAAELDGFKYAYVYPGFNKILQAAGRVIRSENDKGVVLLIDSRFLRRDYVEMFPPEWNGFKRVSAQSISGAISAFWRNSP